MGQLTVPDHYRVGRIGVQDPEDSAYAVLDVTQDMHAREVLWLLVRRYRFDGPSVRADELERLLRASEATYATNVRRRVERAARALKGAKPRSRSRRTTA